MRYVAILLMSTTAATAQEPGLYTLRIGGVAQASDYRMSKVRGGVLLFEQVVPWLGGWRCVCEQAPGGLLRVEWARTDGLPAGEVVLPGVARVRGGRVEGSYTAVASRYEEVASGVFRKWSERQPRAFSFEPRGRAD